MESCLLIDGHLRDGGAHAGGLCALFAFQPQYRLKEGQRGRPKGVQQTRVGWVSFLMYKQA